MENMTFTYNVFNWIKAAVLINEFGTNVVTAEACILRKNETNEEIKTNNITIFKEGKICQPEKHEIVHLGTVVLFPEYPKLAKPTLLIHLKNGETVKYECATMKQVNWTTATYWPEEAVKKLKKN